MDKNKVVGLTHLSNQICNETYVHSILHIPTRIHVKREGVYDRMVRVENER